MFKRFCEAVKEIAFYFIFTAGVTVLTCIATGIIH